MFKNLYILISILIFVINKMFLIIMYCLTFIFKDSGVAAKYEKYQLFAPEKEFLLKLI